MVLWYNDEYTSYATCILIISVLSAVTSLVETKRNLHRIKEMAHYSCTVEVLREEGTSPVDSDELVPGDVIVIPEGCVMPCDVTLLTGSAIVNESMLTGESIPVIKSALPYSHDIYDPDKDQKYTIYGGTKVI